MCRMLVMDRIYVPNTQGATVVVQLSLEMDLAQGIGFFIL